MVGTAFIPRLWRYQKERFPLFAHGLLIGAFTFSAIAYSHICRQDPSPIAVTDYLTAFANTFFIFALLRISDEFKDAAYDREHRPHLPVPRGLVKLQELKWLGLSILAALTLFNILLSPGHLVIYAFVLLYLLLMYNEFFIKHWLEGKQLWYVVSHMMIIPLVDTLASSYDWMGKDIDIAGLAWFFAVSFFNGCTLELGRKIKAAENEEANSYSKSLGFGKSLACFQAVLFVAMLLCLGACRYAQLGLVHYILFFALYAACALYAAYFNKHRTAAHSRTFEKLSGLWAIFMYLNLGLGLYF